MAFTDNLPENPHSEKFSTAIHCTSCKQVGAVFWQEGRTRDGAQRGQSRLLNVSAGFYVASAQADAGNYKIVCDVCETVLPV